MRPAAGLSAASASAAGVEGIARALAVELAPVRVNVVRPGATDTPKLRGFLPEPTDEQVAAYGATLPLGRVARAEEVAAAALFLMANPYARQAWLAVAAVANTVVSLHYYLRVIAPTVLDRAQDGLAAPVPAERGLSLTLTLATVATVLAGVAAEPLLRIAASAAKLGGS